MIESTDSPSSWERPVASNGKWTGSLRRPSGTSLVWLLTVVMLVSGAAFFVLSVRLLPPIDTPLSLPWWALVPAFAATEIFVVHFQYRGDAQTYSLSEVPLVIAIVFAAPAAILLGRIIGAVAALTLHRKQSGLKLAFNVAQFLLFDVCLATFLMRTLLGTHLPVEPAGWIAAFVAIIASDFLAGLMITLASWLHEGPLPLRVVTRDLFFGTIVAVANVSLALIAVSLLWYDPAAAVLLGAVIVVLALSYRAYGSLSRLYARQSQLFEFTRATGRSLSVWSASESVLQRARDLMQSDVAEITLPEPEDSGLLLRFTLRGDGPPEESRLRADELGPVERRVLETGDGVVCPRTSHDQELRAELGRHRVLDAMFAPLRFAGASHGLIMVADRLGSVSTFGRDDLQMLHVLTNHAAVALENGHLVDELRREMAEREHQALHDVLTGLPNRTSFVESVQAAIALQSDDDRRRGFTVMYVDLDDFHHVNDTLGHSSGDVLLQQLGSRLRQLLPDGTVARLGGDEFGLLLPNVLDEAAAEKAASAINSAIAELFTLDTLTIQVRASIGICLYPGHGVEADDLLRHADMAMHLAKSGHAGQRLFSPDLDQATTRRFALVAALRHAIEQEEISLSYQPQVLLQDGATRSVEVLARWSHEPMGQIPPAEFVALAEHTGLIHQFTRLVLERALRQSARWREMGLRLQVAVNLSARNLLDPRLPVDVEQSLGRHGLAASCLTLEVTESSMMADPRSALLVLEELHRLGIRLSVDDFGTGYSSLAYLQSLPVSEVKIDRSFVSHMSESENALTIVRSTVDLGHDLGFEVVAEGVEDAESYRLLGEMGCDLGQGYFLARPMSGERLPSWVADRDAAESRTTPATGGARPADSAGSGTVSRLSRP